MSFCKMADLKMVFERQYTICDAYRSIGHVYPVEDVVVSPGQVIGFQVDGYIESEYPCMFYMLRVPIGAHKGIPTRDGFPLVGQVLCYKMLKEGHFRVEADIGKGVTTGERIVCGFQNLGINRSFINYQYIGLVKVSF